MQLLQHFRMSKHLFYILVSISLVTTSACCYECDDINEASKQWTLFTNTDLTHPISKYEFVDSKGDTTVLKMELTKTSYKGCATGMCSKAYNFKLFGYLTNVNKGFGYDSTIHNPQLFYLNHNTSVNNEGKIIRDNFNEPVYGVYGSSKISNDEMTYKVTFNRDTLLIGIQANQGIQKLEFLGNTYKRIK